MSTQTSASGRRSDLRRLSRSLTFNIGLLIVLFWVGCALFGPYLVPYDPFADDLLNSLMPPSAEHWFGTDQLGRDVFSRVIVGARDILTVAPIATILSTMLGTALGLTMGYFGGVIDEALSRIVDAVLALPTVIVGLLALTALGTSTITVIVVIALSFAPVIARTVRSAVLGERGFDHGRCRIASRQHVLHPVRRNPAQRAAAHFGRSHGALGLCDFHRRHAQFHRLWHPTALARLGAVDFLQLWADRWWLLVGGGI